MWGQWRSGSGSRVQYLDELLTYAANGVLTSGEESASKRPSAGGNIGGRRRADLVAQVFDLHGWRCACYGSATWRWPSPPRETVRPSYRDVGMYCYACNEIKELRRRSQSNEEDRLMSKGDMTGTEGEITAIYRGGMCHAES